MRIKYLVYILLFISICSSKAVVAQGVSTDISKVKPGDITDETLTAYWKKLQNSGMSDDDAYKYLAQNGWPEGDIQTLKNRVAVLGLNNKTGVKTGSSSEKKKIDFSRNVDDTIVKPSVKAKPNADIIAHTLKIYGTDFFNQPTNTFEPNFSVATPKGYVLGPGDDVIVLLNGLNESKQTIKISPEGSLNIDHAGSIYVNGFTIEQATNLIRSKMAKVYPALNSGQTQLAVNLGSTRRIKITLNGEVKTPGGYEMSSLSTFINALYHSGGPTENGSLRNIQIIRNNKVYKTIDFYGFLQNSLLDGNIRLEDQDIIHFPVYKKRVSISGEVKRPAIYELKDGETLEDLIRYAGGYTDIAFKGIASIDQVNTIDHALQSVTSNLFSNYIPRNGDLVTVGAITNRYTNRIVLEGAVYLPNVYELTPGLTLSQLIKEAQGLTPQAYMQRGIIKRTLSNLDKTSISFNPRDIISGKADEPLMREDTVVVLDNEAFISTQKITVAGFVKKPSAFTYRKGLTLTDVIALAGGFANEAADHHVEVSRIIQNQSDTVAKQLVRRFIVNLDSASANTGKNIALEPMDYIYVPHLVNYKALGTVSVQGEVVFPGDFQLQSRDETVLDFLNHAGGITPYASLENTQVYRKGTRVNFDLSSAHDSTTNKKMILLPGDSVYVPRVIPYVEVAGAVNNPQYISYNGHRFKYYINAAAGTTQRALLRAAYIKYPDGLNRPVRHFLFFRSYPTVKPGSKIIVPEKAPDAGIKIGIGDLGVIATALTAIVSIFAILHK
jgi:protein involved in polysaccharide export with SLBB domain